MFLASSVKQEVAKDFIQRSTDKERVLWYIYMPLQVSKNANYIKKTNTKRRSSKRWIFAMYIDVQVALYKKRYPTIQRSSIHSARYCYSSIGIWYQCCVQYY